MAKMSISERDRFALFHQLNNQVTSNRAEQRRVDKLWLALDLDPIALRCDSAKEPPRFSDFDAEKKEYDLTSEQRDMLIDYLEKPMGAGLSRILFPIGSELIRSRDGEQASETKGT